MLIIKITVALLLSASLSIVLFLVQLKSSSGFGSVSNGDWTTSLDTGSENAGVMQKAAVAISGLLASKRESSIYYRLSAIDGKPLTVNCSYRIEGNDYDANWWSITAYGWDNYLLPNELKRYSYNNDNLTRDDSGNWSVQVSAKSQGGDWLPIGPAGGDDWKNFSDHDFDLLLRLYTPGIAYLQAPDIAALPKVVEEGCS
ncbi:MAG: hypothetical protein ACI90U_001810 [Pseudomonadales bacterium]|jgi:hypothetical protein